ncbi:MAG: thymidylate kinase [Armatimonadetes bacterium]|nr:thymidylate kinase [Armatimonadota bacterium]
MFICFIGIDGSGKTLQAKRLAENLNSRGIVSHYTWCRYSPRVLKPFIWLAKRKIVRGVGSCDYSEFTASKRGLLSKPGLGWLWRNVSSLEYLVQATMAVRLPLRKKTVVCDRYVYDMIADLSISLGRSDKEIADLMRHPAIRLLPVPDKVFFLDVPPEVAMSRKDDPNVMGKDYLDLRARIYDYMCREFGFTRIDGAKGIEEIAEQVLEEAVRLAEKFRQEVSV